LVVVTRRTARLLVADSCPVPYNINVPESDLWAQWYQQVRSIPPVIPAAVDFDDDGGVVLDDFADYVTCLTPPGPTSLGEGCDVFDFYFDLDIDLHDFRGLQEIFDWPESFPLLALRGCLRSSGRRPLRPSRRRNTAFPTACEAEGDQGESPRGRYSAFSRACRTH